MRRPPSTAECGRVTGTQEAPVHQFRIQGPRASTRGHDPDNRDLRGRHPGVLGRAGDPMRWCDWARARLTALIERASPSHQGAHRQGEWLAVARCALEHHGADEAVAFDNVAAEFTTEVRLLRAIQAELVGGRPVEEATDYCRGFKKPARDSAPAPNFSRDNASALIAIGLTRGLNVKIGICAWPTDLGPSPHILAKAIEDRGFNSMWIPEHTHVPCSRETPFPLQPGGDFPEYYARMFDPLVALAAAAAVTQTIVLGTSIIVLAQRDPIIFAKETACIDQISNGRFKLGVGYGWSIEEMINHGVDPKLRRGIVREKAAAINALWTEERSSYHGRHVDFDEVWMWPKPISQPRPKMLIGCGPNALGEVVAWADGWIAVDSPSTASEDIPKIRRMAEDAGRDPIELDVHVINVNYTAPASFDIYQAAGVEEIILHIPTGGSYLKGADSPMAILDRYMPFIDRYRE